MRNLILFMQNFKLPPQIFSQCCDFNIFQRERYILKKNCNFILAILFSARSWACDVVITTCLGDQLHIPRCKIATIIAHITKCLLVGRILLTIPFSVASCSSSESCLQFSCLLLSTVIISRPWINELAHFGHIYVSFKET